ncbi:trans-feruloyl-CoA hydratase/vanillin synthase [Neobacillus niacini]|jgi:trans-feruloyl-CoA hydratase/vanillin synthase|uniref:p-hydroxycinnamoyl CoA hydratase/lyase n=1 Tax=Neobacillus driksii TaxID=3035913 RepID=UPI0027869048|nr:p-hydroxycinnamoyl CoA hydratase/lyase [Neobacillus niacini]MDQ0971867.1 trans-feruloyl-CoA hydratase/vanillin synthase [Neobacillus niacini]
MAVNDARKAIETEEVVPGGENVKVEFENGIAWVTLNRPNKRNAMSPALNSEMHEVLDALELDDRCKVLVLTGAGESFSAGMDLKEYFRDIDDDHPAKVMKIRRNATAWQWRKLSYYSKPTIAMVNGWCFGGAFTPMLSCDLAIAADEAIFGLSEVNWGIIPAGNVTRAVAGALNQRDALYYIMTGETFNGQKAAEMGLVNKSVPKDELRQRTRELAQTLLSKNLHVVNQSKLAYKYSRDMDYDTAEEYLFAKQAQNIAQDTERGRQQGLKQFLDDKSFKPGLGGYNRES